MPLKISTNINQSTGVGIGLLAKKWLVLDLSEKGETG